MSTKHTPHAALAGLSTADIEKALPPAPNDGKAKTGRPKGGHKMEKTPLPKKKFRRDPNAPRMVTPGSLDEIRAYARKHSLGLLQCVMEIAHDKKAHAASRIKAIQVLLDMAGYAGEAKGRSDIEVDRMETLTDSQLQTAFRKMLTPAMGPPAKKATPH